jgi:hypothetical protein
MSNETPNQAAPGNDPLKQLLVALERRTEGQSKILHIIAESLQGIEAHLRQIALSSNPAPNYQRPLSEYHSFDWSSIGAGVLKRTRTAFRQSNGTARSSLAARQITGSTPQFGFRAVSAKTRMGTTATFG